MGLTTVKDELALLIQNNDPDISILTKTKLVETQHNSKYIREILSGYKTKFSSSKPQNYVEGKQRLYARARFKFGGLILAVKESWTEGSMVTIHEDSKIVELK